MAWHNWFLPHKDTHKKAHLISWEGLVIYILIFILLQVSLSIISFTKPGILGITANIDQKKLIELTNIERQKKGFSQLFENEALDKAAALKAQNMFTENYWAHFAPSGKTPWDFILGSGYRFTFAGENLAKNFYQSDAVVAAWMASPTHRDNLLNPKYKDIGIAVAEGVLNGQKTTLIVQMFATNTGVNIAPAVDVQGKEIAVPQKDLQETPALAAVIQTNAQTKQFENLQKPLVDPFLVSKTLAFGVIGLLVFLLAADLWVLRKRGVFRMSSHHMAHLALLTLTAGSLYSANPGLVLGVNNIIGPDIFSIKALNILTFGVLVYLIWALLHHKKDKSLTLGIFMEYLLTAALVFILVSGVVYT